MRAWKLRSPLAAAMKQFIDLRRLSGTDYDSQGKLLEYFDRFLVEEKLSVARLRREITDRYQRRLVHLAPRSRGNRLSVVHQFGAYLARTDPFSYVPESPAGPASYAAHPPYIFSLGQVQALLTAASNLLPPGSLRPETYRTLLGLLYSTGIRIGEACALNLEDFHSADQRLHIAAGKFRKARWVAMSDSTCRAVEQYLGRRLRMPPHGPDSPLFLNGYGRPLHHATVHHTFRRLLEQCGIPHHKSTGPRLHDLRHTFAVHRLLAWYRDGQDVNARLPWLATSMGHVDIKSTQVYLRATPELIEHVDRRFHLYYQQHVKLLGGTPS